VRVLAVALALAGATVALANAQSAATQAARCSQLIAYYDRFGMGRSTDSDGRRNHTRLAASLDCANGDYAKGIAAMEALLVAKKFTVPPPGPNVPEDDD
jgi:hypothetical protein